MCTQYVGLWLLWGLREIWKTDFAIALEFWVPRTKGKHWNHLCFKWRGKRGVELLHTLKIAPLLCPFVEDSKVWVWFPSSKKIWWIGTGYSSGFNCWTLWADTTIIAAISSDFNKDLAFSKPQDRHASRSFNSLYGILPWRPSRLTSRTTVGSILTWAPCSPTVIMPNSAPTKRYKHAH